MPARIEVLDNTVIDQIAAGEVVERPGSVVKELIENALDAGATQIDVELEDGGRRLIRVADDGGGMSEDDAPLALERHATSKIRTARDLAGVVTYGFRGEALPSIASIAHLVLETSSTETDGVRVRVSGGGNRLVEPCARRRGTTVEVRELFFNTPARKKFLRAAKTELRAALDAVHTLALGRPDVAFRVTADGRQVYEAPATTNQLERVEATWGRRVADSMLPIGAQEGRLTIRGFIQRPADASPAGRRVQLFINGRPFRDHFLVRAAEQGYVTAIAPGNRPSMVLFLRLEGDGVDVNVHPAKLEVRFHSRFWIERALADAVRTTLAEIGAAPEVDAPRTWSTGTTEHLSGDVPAAMFEPLGDGAQEALFAADAAEAVVGPGAYLQIFDTYIVFPAGDEVVIVDQHSAHERVLFERTLRSAADGVAGQHLLLPLTVELTPPELDAVETHRDGLARIGFEVEPFGGNAIVVHTAPNPHARFQAERCLHELVADLARGRFGGWSNQWERFVATFACRAAVMAGQRLEQREMHELISDLMTTDLPPHDVHGRPTIVRLPRDELDRRFGRR